MVVVPSPPHLSKLKFWPMDLIFHIKAADEMNRSLEGQSEVLTRLTVIMK